MYMKILNLTNHKLIEAQIKAGVFDSETNQEVIKQLNTFKFIGNDFDSGDVMVQEPLALIESAVALNDEHFLDRSNKILEIIQKENVTDVMIGGASYFITFLEDFLLKNGVNTHHALSNRVSIEKEVDGVVIKTNEFRHLGFVSRKAQ